MANKCEILDEINLSDIAGELIQNELLEVAKKHLNSINVKFYTEHGSKKGENFVGAVYRIICKDADDDGNQSEFSLILKIAPSDRACREMQKLHELFSREIFLYDQVISLFHEIQLSKGINPSEYGLFEYTKCYASISEEFSECLFLEDLNLRHFKVMNHRQEVLTFDHVSLVMKALGKFHAFSFALRDQRPNKFKQITSGLHELYWVLLESELNQHYTSLVDRFKGVLAEEKQFDLLEKFNLKLGDDYFQTIRKINSGDSAEPYSVICHGDLTVYNSMFRTDEQGKPVEIQLIDWQFARYASPVTDLVLYLFCSTTKELRDEHFDEFLKIYHESLCDLLQKLGSDAQKLFPFEALLEQFKKFGFYAGLVGSVLLPIVCADVNSIPGFEATLGDDRPITDDMFRIPHEIKQAYNRRVVDMFVDMAQVGCI